MDNEPAIKCSVPGCVMHTSGRGKSMCGWHVGLLKDQEAVKQCSVLGCFAFASHGDKCGLHFIEGRMNRESD